MRRVEREPRLLAFKSVLINLLLVRSRARIIMHSVLYVQESGGERWGGSPGARITCSAQLTALEAAVRISLELDPVSWCISEGKSVRYAFLQ